MYEISQQNIIIYYVQSNQFSRFCPEIIWSIEIHEDSVGYMYVLHPPCPEIYCLRLIDEYYENYAEILVYCTGMCLRQNSGHGV